MDDPQLVTRSEAERRGFIRPQNGGEGLYWSRRYYAGTAEAVVVAERTRLQRWYRLKGSAQETETPND